MNVIHSVEDNNSQIIHVSVNSNDRGATGEKGDSVTNLRITEENRLEATLSNGQTIDGGAIPAIKTRRVFVADMDGIKRTYILPLNIESSQVSYILMNGIVYSDGYVLQSGEITLNYDDLPSGRLEVVLNDNAGNVGGINVSINGKTGDIHLKTINGANLDGDGDIELVTLNTFNNEARNREEVDNNLRNSLNDHETRISNNESTVSSHSNNLSSLNASISSINNQMAVLADDVHEVADNYVPKTRRINDKFLSHDMRLTADDVEALPITAGVTHPIRGELVVNGHVTAEKATQDNHLVTKAQLDAKVAEVVNSAPETLDTLEELSKALGDDPNFATIIANKIGTVDKKIDTEVNKLANKVEANTEDLKATKEKANTNSTNISLLNSTVATNKLSSDTQFANVAKEQDEQNNLIFDILNAFSAESEKGTNLKLNTSATKVLGMTIYGNSEQVKTTGYNIFRFGDMNNSLSQGIKTKMDENGYITSTGTAITDWASVTSFDSNSVLMPGTYTLSIEPSAPIRTSINGELASNNSYKWLGAVDPGQTKVTFTVTEPIKQVRLSIRTVSNQTLNIKFRPMLETGSEAHPYEPYTGGFNNLFDEFSGLPKTVNGITVTNQNGVLKLEGLPTRNWENIQRQEITDKIIHGATYTLVHYISENNAGYLELSRRNKDGTWEHINNRNGKTLTFTADLENYSLYRVQINMGNIQNYNGQPKTLYGNYALFAGNYTEDNLPEYSPFNTPLASPRPQYPQVVKELSGGKVQTTNKNLFYIDMKNITSWQCSFEKYQDGLRITSGGFTGVAYAQSVIQNSSSLLGKTLTLSSKTSGGADYIVIYALSNYKNAIKKLHGLSKEGGTFTLPAEFPAGTESFGLLFYVKPNSTSTFTDIQLEYGDTVTDLVPHESTNFTLPSGLNIYKLTDNIYDEVKLENGVAEMIKRVGKLELSGDESWTKINEPGKNIFICLNIINATKNYDEGVCSHFLNIKSYPNTHGSFAIRTDGTSLAMNNRDTSSITDFKNWLKAEKAKGTPVTVYYEKKTSTEEEITDPTLLSELKKLMGMRTYDGTTNISVTGTGLTPEIKVKYMRKIGS